MKPTSNFVSFYLCIWIRDKRRTRSVKEYILEHLCTLMEHTFLHFLIEVRHTRLEKRLPYTRIHKTAVMMLVIVLNDERDKTSRESTNSRIAQM